MTRFYVVKTQYVGANDQSNTEDFIEIWNQPARTNMSNEPRIEGWCGTSNDWSVTAYGEFDSEEAAMVKIKTMSGGDYRHNDNDDDWMDDKIVKSFKVGQYPQMTAAETIEWFGDYQVNKGDDIDEIISELTEQANQDLNSSLDESALRRHVEELLS